MTFGSNLQPFLRATGDRGYMPDVNGHTGQVISFGCDDHVHFRFAGSLGEFLALVMNNERRAWHPIFMGHHWSLHDQLVLESA